MADHHEEFDPEHWQARLAVLASLVLYLVLPVKFTIKPFWLIPALEAALLITLTIVIPRGYRRGAWWERALGLSLIAVINAANADSLFVLIHDLLVGQSISAQELIMSSIDIWLTNVIIFGLWFWEIDRGGPGRRTITPEHPADFLFPQMSDPKFAAPNWRPQFLDYLYVAITNGTAFSPTDTMPLTITAKALMTVQSLVSLLTVALVAARAVNILR
jgi:hypothetical protein